jgi:hypothetical protein
LSGLNNRSDICNCVNTKTFEGNAVEEKVKRDLTQIAYGPNFGDILYRCKRCGQFWEENLSKATYHDWPPILIKLTVEEVKEKYGKEQEER